MPRTAVRSIVAAAAALAVLLGTTGSAVAAEHLSTQGQGCCTAW